jgi:LPS O-antigen subunit length determinant protein (WzzB/FepE family)
MPDLFDVIWRWRKQVFLLVLISVIITAGIVLFIPKKYSATTTALPAASYATDKTSVFGQNLQSLYSTIGVPDDLDKIVGTAHLDTVYRSVIAQFDLEEHFGIDKLNKDAVQKAATVLKRHAKVFKSDYGELKVKVKDVDKKLVADLANAIMANLQQMYQDIQTSNNLMMLSKINEDYAKSKNDYRKWNDSVSHTSGAIDNDLLNVQKSSWLQQMQEYEKLASQYKLMADVKPQALIIVERATPAIEPDEPRPVTIIIVVAVLSLFFGLFTVLILERKNLR